MKNELGGQIMKICWIKSKNIQLFMMKIKKQKTQKIVP